jgi:flagellar L-ring protein precursor FlgH
MTMKRGYAAMAAVIGVMLAGCATPALEPAVPPPAVHYKTPEVKRTDGSLWNPVEDGAYYFSDYKAHRVGDIIRVNISESSTGKKVANTKTERKSEIEATTNNIFNIQENHPEFAERLGLEAEFEDKFEGKATTDRRGELTATITAIVTEVFPNGNMAIEGHREVLVNNEKETITLTGIIRPGDLSPSNTIQSGKIADARISYNGRGVLNDKQRPGWLIRIVDWVWPF